VVILFFFIFFPFSQKFPLFLLLFFFFSLFQEGCDHLAFGDGWMKSKGESENEIKRICIKKIIKKVN
jgi:hypothetical protein